MMMFGCFFLLQALTGLIPLVDLLVGGDKINDTCEQKNDQFFNWNFTLALAKWEQKQPKGIP
jgi:hypothetical protein